MVLITGAAPQVAATGLLTGAFSAAARVTRGLSEWLSWLGLAVATVAVLSLFSLVFEPATVGIPLGRYLGMVWFVGVGGALLRGGRPGARSGVGSGQAADLIGQA